MIFCLIIFGEVNGQKKDITHAKDAIHGCLLVLGQKFWALFVMKKEVVKK